MYDLHVAHHVLALGAILLSAFVIYVVRVVYQNPTSKVPGPWYTKLNDWALRYHWYYGQQTYWIHSLHQKYGPIVRVSHNQVDFSDIDHVKTIYSTKETFRKSSFYQKLVPIPVANVFSTSDVDHHRRLRRLLAAQMSESSLKLLLPEINELVDLAIQRMKQESESRGVMDVFKWNLFMTTDIIGRLSFGDSFRMLEKGEKNQYFEDLENVASTSSVNLAFPILFSLAHRYSFLPIFKAATGRVHRMINYARQSLHRYQNLVEADPDNVKTTFFTKLFKAKDNDNLSFDEIAVNAQAYIVAGSDTTAISLTYLFWELARRPALRDALLKEIQSLPSDFTERDVRDLPLLNHTIEETLRLHSAAPAALPRSVPLGGASFGDYWLQEHTTVSTQAYTMHRDPDVFPRPLEFEPHRWENPTKAMKDAFMPFGRGPRNCIGLHLAYIELRLATVRFLQEFPSVHLTAREGMSEKDLETDIYFLLSPKGKRCLLEA